MKFLKINDNKAFFLKDKEEPENWTEIDKIEKEDLINLKVKHNNKIDFSFL